MRVALVGPVYPYRGGIAHYTAMLAQTLRAMGHEVRVVSFKRQYPRWLFPGASDKDPSLQAVEAGAAEYLVDSLNPLTWVKASFHIRRFAPDVTVIPWWTVFWAPAWMVIGGLLRRMLRAPLVFLCHNVSPHESSVSDRWLTRRALGSGTHYIVQSPQEETALLDLLPRASVTIVPHPIYDMFSDSAVSRDVARGRLDLSSSDRILLFFGIVRAYKGLMDLLDAMPEVARQVGSVRLVVAGEFWEPKERYLAKMEQLGIRNLVRIDDWYIRNEDVADYFAAADLVVTPYRRATGSGVVQMAMGLGVPQVTTLGWLFDGVAVPRCYRVVPPEDSVALYTAIIDLLNEEPLSCDAAEVECLHRAFSWQRLGLTMEHLVREAAEST